MLRIYLKQAWSLLKENPLVSGLSIAGTVRGEKRCVSKFGRSENI